MIKFKDNLEFAREVRKIELLVSQQRKLKLLIYTHKPISYIITFLLLFLLFFPMILIENHLVLVCAGIFPIGLIYGYAKISIIYKNWIYKILKIDQESIQQQERKEKEKNLVYHLNQLTDQIKFSNFNFEDAIRVKIILEKEFELIKIFGCQLNTVEEYKTKFDELNTTIQEYHSRNLSKKDLHQNKTEQTQKSASNISKTPTELISNFDLQKQLFDDSLENKNEFSNVLSDNNKKRPLKIDHLELHKKRQLIGLLGEEFILNWERKRLEKSTPEFKPDKLIHISKSDDSAGYDILSYCEKGNPKYIEVKTTTESLDHPFYLTETELSAMRELENYFIYRVYNLNVETGQGSVFPIDCSKDFEEHFKLQPVSYKVLPI